MSEGSTPETKSEPVAPQDRGRALVVALHHARARLLLRFERGREVHGVERAHGQRDHEDGRHPEATAAAAARPERAARGRTSVSGGITRGKGRTVPPTLPTFAARVVTMRRDQPVRRPLPETVAAPAAHPGADRMTADFLRAARLAVFGSTLLPLVTTLCSAWLLPSPDHQVRNAGAAPAFRDDRGRQRGRHPRAGPRGAARSTGGRARRRRSWTSSPSGASTSPSWPRPGSASSSSWPSSAGRDRSSSCSRSTRTSASWPASPGSAWATRWPDATACPSSRRCPSSPGRCCCSSPCATACPARPSRPTATPGACRACWPRRSPSSATSASRARRARPSSSPPTRSCPCSSS